MQNLIRNKPSVLSRWSSSAGKVVFQYDFLVFCFSAEALTSTHHTDANTEKKKPISDDCRPQEFKEQQLLQV